MQSSFNLSIRDESYMSQKAANISTDMSFLKQLAQPTVQQTALRSARVGNIGSLAQLLKFKNSRFAFSQQTRQTGQEWVKRRGGDLNPLIERVKQIKRQTKNKQEQMKSQSECHFYMPAVTYQNQDTYIKNNFEFGVINTMQSIMSGNKQQSNLTKRILHRRRKNKLDNQQDPLDGLPVLNLQIRNPRKKQEYLKCTMQILGLEQPLRGVEWSTVYGNAMKQEFWQIISNQMSFYFQQSSRQNPISILSLASLKMVESQLNTELPTHYDSILYYLTNNYLGKMKGNYGSESHLGPIWGISFVLYRAGRKDSFFKVIQNQPDLVKLFQDAQASIAQGKPKKFLGVEEKDDLFYNQLVYALKGQPKYSIQALCNPENLDIVWVFLRNAGIFPDNANIFTGLRKKLYQSYKGYLISAVKIKNLLYLLGYSQIAQIGCNDLMDQDDYVHYLITLFHSPLFRLLSKQKKDFVQKKLTQELVQYIQQLLLQNKADYINYMVVLPPSSIADEISSIIASSQLLDGIDWKYLRSKISPTIFENLVHLSLEKYVAFHQDYIQVAKKQCQLLNNKQAALNFIIEMFIKQSLFIIKVDPEEIRKGEFFVKDLLSRDEALYKQYWPVFGFFEQYRGLIKVLQERNELNMYNFMRQAQYILIAEQVPVCLTLALEKLMKHSGFECFIYYMRNIVKCCEIALIRIRNGQDLKQISIMTLSAFLDFMKADPYNKFSKLQSVNELLKVLQQNSTKSNDI